MLPVMGGPPSGLQRLAMSADTTDNTCHNNNHPQAASIAAMQQPLMSRAKLQELVSSLAPGERMDPMVESALLRIAETFVVDVASQSAELARLRKSKSLDIKDISLILEREWNMNIPGFSDADDRKIAPFGHPTVAHQTRSVHASRAAGSAAHLSQQQQHQSH